MLEVKNVLVLLKMEEEEKRELEAVCPGACYIYTRFGEVKPEEVANAEIILGNVSIEMLKSSKKLKWMQLSSAGSDYYQKESGFPEGAILTNAVGGFGPQIAEHMLGALLMLMKKFHIYYDNQKTGYWHGEGVAWTIYGSTTLIIGMGDIGSEFAKRMKALGSYVIGIRRSNAGKPDCADEMYASHDIDKLLSRADIIALAVPKTEETYQLLSAKRIALLKENAIVINVGRGTAVDTDALTNALEKGSIGGAALDVTDPEPLPQGHRMWKTKNALITPHVAGFYRLGQTHNRINEIALNNFKAFFNGNEMTNVVDFKKGY